MTMFYDARGNIYGVVSPEVLRQQGIAVAHSATQAARDRAAWTLSAVASECGWGSRPHPVDGKAHRCDGLLVGPFQAEPPFDLLIVNTDGSLAERSGNGLTIFAQALSDAGLMTEACELRVHHDKSDAPSPVATQVEPAVYEYTEGFWLALGTPEFGPGAVGAQGVEQTLLGGVELSHVTELAAINPQWASSQFVRVGNPHCVTLVEQASALPDNQQMQQPPLFEPLQALAFAPPVGRGQPWGWGQFAMGCPAIQQPCDRPRVRARRGPHRVFRDQRQCGGLCGVARGLGRVRRSRRDNARRHCAGEVACTRRDVAERQPVRDCASASVNFKTAGGLT